MQINEILAAIEGQISQLQQARALLANNAQSTSSAGKAEKTGSPAAAKAFKRRLSAEGKARIAAAQRARWAAKRKAPKPALLKSPSNAVKRAVKSTPKPKAGNKSVVPAKRTVRVESATAVRTPATQRVEAAS
jgi:hypothetical protein